MERIDSSQLSQILLFRAVLVFLAKEKTPCYRLLFSPAPRCPRSAREKRRAIQLGANHPLDCTDPLVSGFATQGEGPEPPRWSSRQTPRRALTSPRRLAQARENGWRGSTAVLTLWSTVIYTSPFPEVQTWANVRCLPKLRTRGD